MIYTAQRPNRSTDLYYLLLCILLHRLLLRRVLLYLLLLWLDLHLHLQKAVQASFFNLFKDWVLII